MVFFMVGGVRFTRFGGVIAVLLASMSLASADQPLPRSHFAPIATPTIEIQSFALPYTTSKFDLGAIDTSKFRKAAPEMSFDTVDLGTSALRLNVTDIVTQPAPDTPDFTNIIVPLRPGKKRANPRYFGFVLTTPTH